MYCVHCGAEINDEAVVCVHCGCAVEKKKEFAQPAEKDDAMETVVKIFLILGCISWGWLLIPLIWCIPITVSILQKFKNQEPIGTGLKICTLLFVNLIAGVCLLCMGEN